MNKIDFAYFLEAYLEEDRYNAHEKTRADWMADQGDLKGARAVDIGLAAQAAKGFAAKKAAEKANPFFSGERMAKHVDTGPSFGQGKKEQAKGIRDEKGKLTPKGEVIYKGKNARLAKHIA